MRLIFFAPARRWLPGAALLALTLLFVSNAQADADFGLANVQAMAQELAHQSYEKPADDLPSELAGLPHDAYRTIVQRRDAWLWRADEGPFSVELLPRGNNYRQTVKINLVDDAGIHPQSYDAEQFDFGDLELDAQTEASANFSGFALHFDPPAIGPAEGDHANDDSQRAKGATPAADNTSLTPQPGPQTLVFQGASFFFGLVGQQTQVGTNARGLAVDTGLDSGEEFPRFVQFWIAQPGADADHVDVYALLDSRRVTGAYHFAIHFERTLRIDVQASLYLRDAVSVLGLAPIGSMYFYGENDGPDRAADYHPEMHDSDGLQLHLGSGEKIWRPLLNPRRMLATSFATTNPQGFGLMQRDTDFASYQNLDRRFDQSANVWVTPHGNWGAGRVVLVLLPTPDATNNNVAAFWAPDAVPEPQQPLDYAYTIAWQPEGEQTQPAAAWVAQTRTWPVARDDGAPDHGFVIDFVGPALTALDAAAQVAHNVTVNDNGELIAQQLRHNPVTGGWRLQLQVRRADAKKPLELRAFLRTPRQLASETWSYIVPPDD